MTTYPKMSLAEQRQLLREQLQAQRRVIAAQLAQKEAEEQRHPRSMLMRFLTQQNGFKIVAEAAALMVGTHWLKSAVGRALSKTLQSLLINKLRASP